MAREYTGIGKLQYKEVPELMGRWRLEVKPGAPRERDVFLHVLQAADQTVTAMDEARVALEGGDRGADLPGPRGSGDGHSPHGRRPSGDTSGSCAGERRWWIATSRRRCCRRLAWRPRRTDAVSRRPPFPSLPEGWVSEGQILWEASPEAEPALSGSGEPSHDRSSPPPMGGSARGEASTRTGIGASRATEGK